MLSCIVDLHSLVQRLDVGVMIQFMVFELVVYWFLVMFISTRKSY